MFPEKTSKQESAYSLLIWLVHRTFDLKPAIEKVSKLSGAPTEATAAAAAAAVPAIISSRQRSTDGGAARHSW